MTVIIVTGTPGTGKTTAAKKIAKQKNLKYIDVNKLIEEKKLFESIDLDRGSKIVDTDKLNKVLIDIIKDNKGVVIDSHLSHYLPKKYADLVVVAKCGVKELGKRLRRRKYSKDKIKENLQAEIFDICYNEAVMEKHKILVIDTTKGFDFSKIKI